MIGMMDEESGLLSLTHSTDFKNLFTHVSNIVTLCVRLDIGTPATQ
jgi:hypothetical protein